MLKRQKKFISNVGRQTIRKMNRIISNYFSNQPDYIDIITNENMNTRNKSIKTEKISRRDIMEYKREIPMGKRGREFKQHKKKKRSLENFERFPNKTDKMENLLMLDQTRNDIRSIPTMDLDTKKRIESSETNQFVLEELESPNLLNSEAAISSPTPRLMTSMKNIKPKYNATKEHSNLVAKGKRNKTASKDPDNLKIHLKGIPKDWSDAYLQKYFDPEMKTISDIIRVKNSLGQETNRCIMTFYKETEKEEFINRYFQDYINSNIAIEKISVSSFREKSVEDKLQIYRDSRQLEVYNLPYELTYIELFEILSEFGKVVELQMPMRSEKFNKGFALVLYSKNQEADLCNQKMQEFYMFGRQIKARQKFMSMDTQRKRIAVKSDHVLQKAEYDEVQIRGLLFAKYLQNKEFIKNYQFDFIS